MVNGLLTIGAGSYKGVHFIPSIKCALLLVVAFVDGWIAWTSLAMMLLGEACRLERAFTFTNVLHLS